VRPADAARVLVAVVPNPAEAAGTVEGVEIEAARKKVNEEFR
jgi:hypothetical protein